MLAQLISSLLASFFTVHTFLFAPKFAALPVFNAPAFVLPTAVSLPVKRLGAAQVPALQASAYMAIDQASAEVLAEKNADQALFPASTTKIMTAVVVLEHMQLDDVITVPDAGVPREGSSLKLIPGERLTVKSALEGLLVHSGNDAAELLAGAYPGGRTAFITEMNRRAKDLHMTHTVYMNPSGLIDPQHVTSVRDLLILARFAMQNEAFATIVKEKHADIKSVDGRFVHPVDSTNELLGKLEGVEGVKTGWTEDAGECFVSQVTRDGHTILTAVLHSPSRFTESSSLINWIYDSYHWETKQLTEW